ncbi:dolichol-phosphate mannosyltransferase subunit 3 [Skeletonema marinoi]|uniref:Dolichol-phosphate mannosyltransferase subunit 3 n=1 Tax=Skeletonema marinoi TaxID=267567 RepID=A0AAD8Y439_9STRA|nr:dolichol-phosphate mannosyltransferase subunit 3 [Skeletonema marinoi]|mmetsp:Transcript_6058/g.10131  ORF Transcript_6058/g.10131 Transcript_6058/m.10131 type:complete len:113 (-) Transcript_6058:2308-2646(-)
MGLLRRIDPQMTGLLRYQLFLSIGILFIGLWKASITRLATIQKTLSTSIDPSTTKILVIYLPIWAIILLGIYALSSVLYKVATFGDCPEAAVELSGQIEEAKQKLTKQGFKF